MALKDVIKEDIRIQLTRLVEKYSDMSVRFEYNDSRQVFLVSYHFEVQRNDEDPIWDEIFNIQSFFDEKFGVDAPLFCEDDRLYALSSRAEILRSSRHIKIEDAWTINIPSKANPVIFSSPTRIYSEMFCDGLPEYSYAA